MNETEFNKSEELAKVMYKKFPESHVTYFPVEQKYQCHVWGKPLGGMFSSRIDAIRDALKSE